MAVKLQFDDDVCSADDGDQFDGLIDVFSTEILTGMAGFVDRIVEVLNSPVMSVGVPNSHSHSKKI